MTHTEKMERWKEIHRPVTTRLEERAEALDQFRDMATTLFRGKLAEVLKTTNVLLRKPNISLRLIAEGERAKVIVSPRWAPPRGSISGRLVCQDFRVELWTEVPVTVRDIERREHDCVKLSSRLALSRNDKGWTVNRLYVATAAEEADLIVRTLVDFTTDARAVLARSQGACCICGRRLSDELSRSRGVGPECVRIIDMVAFKPKSGPLTLILPELVAS